MSSHLLAGAVALAADRVPTRAGRRCAAHYDHDAVTLAAEAVLALLSGPPPALPAPAALLFASVTPPYDEGGSAQVIAEIAGLGDDVFCAELTATPRDGLAALRLADGLVCADGGPVLVCAAHARRSEAEREAGDGAVALLVGDRAGLATLTPGAEPQRGAARPLAAGRREGRARGRRLVHRGARRGADRQDRGRRRPRADPAAGGARWRVAVAVARRARVGAVVALGGARRAGARRPRRHGRGSHRCARRGASAAPAAVEPARPGDAGGRVRRTRRRVLRAAGRRGRRARRGDRGAGGRRPRSPVDTVAARSGRVRSLRLRPPRLARARPGPPPRGASFATDGSCIRRPRGSRASAGRACAYRERAHAALATTSIRARTLCRWPWSRSTTARASTARWPRGKRSRSVSRSVLCRVAFTPEAGLVQYFWKVCPCR